MSLDFIMVGKETFKILIGNLRNYFELKMAILNKIIFLGTSLGNFFLIYNY